MILQGARHLTPSTVRFRFDEAFGSKPSSFEFRFLTLGQVFTYGFDIELRDIRAEWLTVLVDGEDQIVFERDKEGKTHPGAQASALFPKDKKIAEFLAAMELLPLRTTQLLLNRVATFPSEFLGRTFKAILGWLTEQLLVLLPDHRSANLLDLLYEDAEFRRFPCLHWTVCRRVFPCRSVEFSMNRHT